jgi:hypothetical protein
MATRTKVFRPSIEKFWQGVWWDAIGSPPTIRAHGVAVDRYTSVLASIHPSDPALSAAPVGFSCVVRVWRFMSEARDGEAVGQGQWYSREELPFTLDGNAGVGGPMQWRLPTLQAEKMFLELIEVVNAPATWELVPSLTVLTYRDENAADECYFESMSTPSEIMASTLDTLADNGSLYSTVKDAWAASYVDATTISVLLDGNPLGVDEQAIVAVTRKVPGDETEMDIWIRGQGLDWDYDNATGNLTLDGVALAATDILEVYWEGPQKATGVEGAEPTAMDDSVYLAQSGAKGVSALPDPVTAGRMVQLLADLYGRLMSAAFTIATQSDRNEEVQPLNDKYITEGVDIDDITDNDDHYWPSEAGATMDSWKDWGVQLYVIGGTAGDNNARIDVYLEVSSGMVISGDRYWDDASLAGYVVGSITTPTDGDQTIRELGETSLISSTGTTAASRVINFDNLNIKYWRLRYEVTLFEPTTVNAEFHAAIRRKAM